VKIRNTGFSLILITKKGGHKLIEQTGENTLKNEKKLGRTIRLKHTTNTNLTLDYQTEKMEVVEAMK